MLNFLIFSFLFSDFLFLGFSILKFLIIILLTLYIISAILNSQFSYLVLIALIAFGLFQVAYDIFCARLDLLTNDFLMLLAFIFLGVVIKCFFNQRKK